MRRSSSPGFPALIPLAAVAFAALAAPAWALCDVDARDPAERCHMPAPAPRPALCDTNAILRGDCPLPASRSAVLPLPAAPPLSAPPPLVVDLSPTRSAEQRARAEIDAHFDAELAAEAARHWWKP